MIRTDNRYLFPELFKTHKHCAAKCRIPERHSRRFVVTTLVLDIFVIKHDELSEESRDSFQWNATDTVQERTRFENERYVISNIMI